MTVHSLSDPARLGALPDGPTPRLTLEEWTLTRPDLHLGATEAGRLVARASVWWTPCPVDPDRPEARVGMIGHLEGGREALASLLEDAMEVLRDNGIHRVLAPMDGSTWHAYRVVTDAAPEGVPHPPFALEPTSTPEVTGALEVAGFTPIAHYHSALVPHLPDRSADLVRLGTEAEKVGVGLRSFDPTRAEDELDALYRISREAFARNPFYVPIPCEAFLATYRPLVDRVDPRLIVLAEQGGSVVGVGFGLPDLAQAARCEAVDTVVVKTVAVLPEAAGQGLGSLLVLAVEEAARQAGLSRSIHALMHDGNRSVRISRHSDVQILRRYALLGRDV
ncbi:MAG: GNAT family N-acetyltransferase [Bacteroidota bacterium]